MKRIKIAILFGGCNTEYEVSLQSAYSVIQSLSPEKYDVILLGITREGKWMKFNGPAKQIKNGTWMNDNSCVYAVISPDRDTHGILAFQDGNVVETHIDVAFPVLHGKNGEDGTIQGLLELAGIPCVGCGSLSSALCMDKDIAHKLAHLAGIKTPPSILLGRKSSDTELLEQAISLKYPLFVKPANSGSSIGITKVLNNSELPDAVDVAFEHDDKVIIEEAVAGFEVGCSVLGNNLLTIGEVDEVELSHGFFDYTEKYTLQTSKIHMPARIDLETAERIKQTAITIYRVLNCSGFARVDLFLTPDKEIVFNEVNTIPGFTAHSRFPNMLKGIGMTFDEIVDALIRLALEE